MASSNFSLEFLLSSDDLLDSKLDKECEDPVKVTREVYLGVLIGLSTTLSVIEFSFI